VTKSPLAGQLINVGVRVAAAKTGAGVAAPGGTADVSISGSSCQAYLSGSGGVATGQCAITAPAPGTYHVNASYLGQSPYGGSQAAVSVPVKVAQERSSTALKLSARRIAYGREHGERLTVAVRPQFTGLPAGRVVISVKGKTICTRHLENGTASCTLTRKQLRPGSYRLIAQYQGSSAFIGSKSAAQTLKIFRP
jgi:hypothetical protein